MVKNTIQFIVDESGQILNTPVGKVKAQTNLSNRIQLITPATISTGVAVNYNIYDSRNLRLKQYLKPSMEKGYEVIDKASSLYQIAHDWNVFYCDIYSTALSAISKYRSGKVGMSFDFYETVPGDLAVIYKGEFGFGKNLPEIATDGDYYICDSYNYWLDGTLYNKGDVLVWVEDNWISGEVNNISLTSPYDISIAPTIYYESQEVSDEASQIIGEIAGDVQDLQANLNDNYYDKIDSDERFVHLTNVNEEIEGTKKFIKSPKVPNASADMHAVNRSDMYGYTYSKTEINNLTEPIGFATYQNFIDWLAGTYSRSDGLLPTGLLVGKKIIIKEEGQNNYQVAELPAVNITDFKVLVEDNKFLEEIGAKAYKTITATDGQEFVEDLKDEIDLKAQIIEMEDLTIEIADWIDDSGNIYFDYENENFTVPTKQFFEFVSNSKDQNEAIANDGFSILALETILDGADYKVRLFANKTPSIDIVLKVSLINYTNEVFEAGEIQAHMIAYDNTASSLYATDMQEAIDEVAALNLSKTNIYVDSNRTDSYAENGSVNKPFKFFTSALDHIRLTSSITKASIHLATGSYTWTIQQISKPISVFGNGSTVIVSGSPSINNQASFYDVSFTAPSYLGIYIDAFNDVLFENCNLNNISFLRQRPVTTTGGTITLRNSKTTRTTGGTFMVYEKSTVVFDNSLIDFSAIEVVGTLISKNSEISTYGGIITKEYTDSYGTYNGVLYINNTTAISVIANSIDTSESFGISEFNNVKLRRVDNTLGKLYHNTRQVRLSKIDGEVDGTGMIRPINKDYAPLPEEDLEPANKLYVDTEIASLILRIEALEGEQI